jgi:hypothetical protein
MCKHVAAVLYGVGARLDRSPELLFRLRGVDHGELVAVGADAVAAATGRGGRRRRVAEGDLAGVFGIELAGELGPQAAVPEAPGEPDEVEAIGRPARGRKPAAPSEATPRGRKKGRPLTPAPVEPQSQKAPSKPPARPPAPATRSARAPAPPAPVLRVKNTAGRTSAGVASMAAAGAAGRAPQTGAAVARLRAALRLTRAELARLLGVSAASVGNWERAPGKLHLQDRTAEALRQAAGLTQVQAKARLARRGRAR